MPFIALDSALPSHFALYSFLEGVLNIKPEELTEFEAEVKRDYSA